jgi:ferredoxin-NADP reductase
MGGGCMGGGRRKEFYPSLMALSTLSPEQRQRIEAEARSFIRAGTDEIASAQNALRQAIASGDTVGAEQAASRLRDALNQVKSGTTTLRSLAEGKPPQQIAFDWFKEQMNLAPNALTHESVGPLGLSWFHLITMSLVAALAGAMLVIYIVRMRRANALVTRLITGSSASGASGTLAAPPAKTVGPAAANPPSTPAAAGSAKSAASAPPPPTGPAQASNRPAIAPTSSPDKGPKRPWSGALRVAAIFRETPAVKTFRLMATDAEVIPFTFLPGQFLTFSAEIDGKKIRRSYTIASSPTQCDYVEITVKREELGAESRYLHDHVAVGDRLEVSAPSGVFVFTGAEADSIGLIGGGVGITPLMCIIRYLIARAFRGDIFLLYGAKTPQDFIFREELDYLKKRHSNLHVAVTIERAEGTEWTGAVGHISKEFIASAIPEIARRRVHVCGPPGMMEAVKAHLLELGVASNKIKTEAFGPAKGAVPAPGPVADLVSEAPSSATAPAPPAMAAPSSAQASIRFSKSNRDVPLPPDKSVLEIAESVGVPIDFQCRVGTCGVCKILLLEGEVTMEVEEALTPEDKAGNIILACQAKSIGNLVVEA